MEKNEEIEAGGRERRSEPRTIIDQYYSVQFFVRHLDALYQFVLWDISPGGMCILIDNDSEVLSYLSVGNVLKIKYYPRDLYGETRICNTEIRHITKGYGTRFSDYHMVGLKMLG